MLIPDQTPHSHSFALLVIQSLDDGTIPNSMVEIGLALVRVTIDSSLLILCEAECATGV